MVMIGQRPLNRHRIAWAAILVILIGGSSALRDVRVFVPQAVLRGHTAALLCLFDLEGDSLYSVKWYKGRREFYRFTPRESPAMKIFPINGLDIEKIKCNATQVTLRNVQLSVSGKYSCEVSADAPSFHTALVTGEMDVVEVPIDRPVITGVRPRYKPGEVLHGNCSSSWSRPAARLAWFINGEQAPVSTLVAHPPLKEPGGDKELSVLGLRILLTHAHFPSGRLKIRCIGSLAHLYWQSTENSVEVDRPRGAAAAALQTDKPPPGHLDMDLPEEDHHQPRSGSSPVQGNILSVAWFLLLVSVR